MDKSWRKKVLTLILTAILSAHTSILPIAAQTPINLTIVVGGTNLILSGWSAPGALITFIENDIVIGTTSSDSNGFFTKTFHAISAGIHDVSLYSTNPDNLTTPTLNYSVAIQAGVSTYINDILFPPTISAEGSLISGYTKPSSTVELFVGDQLFTLTSESDGGWSFDIEEQVPAIEPGVYEVYAQLQFGSGNSLPSIVLTILIEEEEVIPLPSIQPNDGTDSGQDGSDGIFPERVNPLIRLFPELDRNGNGIPDYAELFEFIRAWVENWRSSKSGKCDLNNDGVCDLIDFSISLYYINR